MAKAKIKLKKKPTINKGHSSLPPKEWNKLKDLYSQSNLSLLKFCKEQCINYKTSRYHHEKEKWKKARETFRSKVSRKIEVKAIGNWVKTFDKLGGTWEKLLNHTIKSLDGKIVEGTLVPISLYEQGQASQVLDRITHNLRLLSGQSTENITNSEAEFKDLNDKQLEKEIAIEIKELEELKTEIKRESSKKKV